MGRRLGRGTPSRNPMTRRRNVFKYTWAGTAMGPFPGPFWSVAVTGTMTAGDLAVTAGVLKETTPTGTASNGNYFSGRSYQYPLASAIGQYAEIVVGNQAGAAWPRSQGVAVAGNNAAMTNCVIVTAANFAGSACQIQTKVGTVLTSRATADVTSVAGDRIGCLVSVNSSGQRVYTVFKNGVAQALTWTDTTNVITPGPWCGPAFGAQWSSGYFGSMGATGFMAYNV